MTWERAVGLLTAQGCAPIKEEVVGSERDYIRRASWSVDVQRNVHLVYKMSSFSGEKEDKTFDVWFEPQTKHQF